MKHLRISQPLSTSETELHQIGYVHSTQGLKGDIFIVLKSTDESWLDEWEDLILRPGIKHGDNRSPADVASAFFTLEIQSLREHKKQGKHGVAIRLFDLESCSDVEGLVGHEVWIPQSFLQAKKGENIFLEELRGFSVVDGRLGKIGTISGFSSNGVQDLIEVSYKGNVHLIPLVQAFIDRMAVKEKTIYMNIPEGLLDTD